MFVYLNKKAQSTAEYVIVLGLIVAAVVAMQTYIKRGFQGRLKNATDFTDQNAQTAGVVQFTGAQYEPYYLSSQFDSQHNADSTDTGAEGGAVSRGSTEASARTGYQKIDKAE